MPLANTISLAHNISGAFRRQEKPSVPDNNATPVVAPNRLSTRPDDYNTENQPQEEEEEEEGRIIKKKETEKRSQTNKKHHNTVFVYLEVNIHVASVV